MWKILLFFSFISSAYKSCVADSLGGLPPEYRGRRPKPNDVHEEAVWVVKEVGVVGIQLYQETESVGQRRFQLSCRTQGQMSSTEWIIPNNASQHIFHNKSLLFNIDEDSQIECTLFRRTEGSNIIWVTSEERINLTLANFTTGEIDTSREYLLPKQNYTYASVMFGSGMLEFNCHYETQLSKEITETVYLEDDVDPYPSLLRVAGGCIAFCCFPMWTCLIYHYRRRRRALQRQQDLSLNDVGKDPLPLMIPTPAFLVHQPCGEVQVVVEECKLSPIVPVAKEKVEVVVVEEDNPQLILVQDPVSTRPSGIFFSAPSLVRTLSMPSVPSVDSAEVSREGSPRAPSLAN